MGTLIQGRSFVQSQLAASSCEAEYYAYSTAGKEGEYVRLLLRDLVVVPTLLGDYQHAIAAANNSSQRSCTGHIDFTVALCRYFVSWSVLLIKYVPWLRISIPNSWAQDQLRLPVPRLVMSVGHRGRFMS